MSKGKTALTDRVRVVSTRQKSSKPAATAPLSEKVRLSADIAPEAYRALVSWCADIATKIGRTRIQHVWVIRALVDEMQENPELQAKIIERLQEEHIDL